MRPSIVFVLIAVLAALGLGPCGESKQDKAQLTSALQQLGDAYKQSFAKVDC
jgi:hypothetical protein